MRDQEGEVGSSWELSDEIIAACIEVHRHLGPGLLESAYQKCLCHELSLRRLRFESQKALPVVYKGVRLDCGYRLDLVVAGRIIVEVKAVDRLTAVHEAQVITHLKLTELDVGLLVNFNVAAVRHGLRRLSRRARTRAWLPVGSPEAGGPDERE